jgi:hypothetical protein
MGYIKCENFSHQNYLFRDYRAIEARVFAPAKPIQPNLKVTIKPGTYPRVVSRSLLENIRISWKRLPGTTLDLFSQFKIGEEKKVYNNSCNF